MSSTRSHLRTVSVSAVLLLLLSGCQSMQLENHTIRQARTLSDLQYRQVMDNLAGMASNPSSLPYFAAAQTGHTTIVMNPTVSNVVNWDLLTVAGALFNTVRFDKGMITTGYSQQNNEAWDTSSSLDPLQLYMMQGLYRKALGAAIPVPQQAVLDKFFSPPAKEAPKAAYSATHPHYDDVYALAMQQLYQSITPGCFGVGRKHDVPKDACYVGHNGDCYVWVTSSNLEALTNLTITIIDVATIDTASLSAAPRTPKPVSAGQTVFPSIQ